MPDPVDPLNDDSPTSPIDLPATPPPQPPAAAMPPVGAAPWDAPGPTPPSGTWPAPPAGPAAAPAPSAGPAPTPAADPGPGPSGYAAPAAPQAGARPPTQPLPDRQSGLVAGIVLVVVGVAFLLIRVADAALGSSSWPLWLIVPGLAMLAGSFAIPPRGGLGLAVPGTIIAIVGGILWVQETYDVYGTWAYAWALVAPTGPGLAMLLYGLVRGDHELAADGLRIFLIGIGLFLGFAFFFEGVLGISGHRIPNMDEVLPYVCIGFGALLVVASLFTGRRDRGDRREASQA
jgi:hypothetical protein